MPDKNLPGLLHSISKSDSANTDAEYFFNVYTENFDGYKIQILSITLSNNVV